MTTHQEALEAAASKKIMMSEFGPVEVTTLAPSDNGLVGELRNAMDGVTPGPWAAEMGGKGGWVKGSTGEWCAMSCGDTNDSANANAAYIAVCSPDNISRLLDTITALTAENERLRAERDAARHHTSNLLARIHRDGGHYETEHGTSKAVEDADAIVSHLYTAEARTAALQTLLDKAVWQPITEDDPSPPHDVPVLLWSPPSLSHPDGLIEARPFSTGRSGLGWSERSQHGYATHWMPLPAAPTAIQEARK